MAALKINLLLLLTLIFLLVLYKSHSEQSQQLKDLYTSNQYISSDQGNDIAVYTPSISDGKWDYYDAGLGIDTLWLRLTNNEIENPYIQADILRFYYFLINNSDPFRVSGEGPKFEFSAFHLTVRNFENIIIERISEPEGKSVTLPNPAGRVIQDSSVDSLS